MKITRRQLKRIIREVLDTQQGSSGDIGPDEVGLDVLDPCEVQDMEEAAFTARFPNWPVSLSEVIGECGTGIMYVELTFAGGERAGAEFNFDEYKGDIPEEELKSKKKITKPELAKMYDAGVVSGLSDADETTLKKVGVTEPLPKSKPEPVTNVVPDAPPHNRLDVGAEGHLGVGSYYYNDNKLVAFSPKGSLKIQVFEN